MRANDHQFGWQLTENTAQLLRDPKLRWSAAPEQVAGSGGHDHYFGPICLHGVEDFGVCQTIELPIENGGLVPLLFEQRFRVAELERQMRLTAAEIYASLEAPMRIDESESHGAN
jgi:hypothetical protein